MFPNEFAETRQHPEDQFQEKITRWDRATATPGPLNGIVRTGPGWVAGLAGCGVLTTLDSHKVLC
jgi:hypothetical protein